MSKEHAKIAKLIPGSVIRCGPRRMLQYICEKCGSGEAFKAKNGKTLRVPEGKFQCTDKEMMKVLGIESRRVTMRENRLVIKKKLRGAVTIKHEFKQGCRYPVIVYYVDLEKLKELVPKERTETVHHNQTESIQDNHTETVRGRTETDTHTGFPSETGVSSVAGKASASEAGDSQEGSKALPEPTQRSAVRRSVSADSTYPEISKALDTLSGLEIGYEPGYRKETLVRIHGWLQAENVSCSQLFEYLSKAKWIPGKVKGRLDWIPDRLESDDPRSAGNQFLAWLESKSRPKEGLIGYEKTGGNPFHMEIEYIQGELDESLEGNLRAFDILEDESPAKKHLPDCKLPADHIGKCYHFEPKEV
ncbi:MAG: hypothetical protein WCA19_24100 [Candidatus Acidiferrales bacterium]